MATEFVILLIFEALEALEQGSVVSMSEPSRYPGKLARNHVKELRLCKMYVEKGLIGSMIG